MILIPMSEKTHNLLHLSVHLISSWQPRWFFQREAICSSIAPTCAHVHNVDRRGRSREVPTKRAVPIPGLLVSPVSGDRIELFVQTIAKLQKSGRQETTTKLVRRCSTIIAADWMKVKAASATPHCKESFHTLQAGFSPAALNSTNWA